MAYQALYRRYRPKCFSDVKGQGHITTTLRNQLNTDRVGHAYLFTGTRGTGKTTVARILAASINCLSPAEDGSPCGECAMCKAIESGISMNVVELDAASNNSVDDIRQLTEDMEYPPTEGKYRVYIIDEVHMLSTQAFNALLKSLEEPPSYVVFILATTDVHKVPITILSRCQRYDFKRMTIETIENRMKHLMEEDGHKVEEKGLAYIARRADGSMRDALSLLDQCISFYPKGELGYDQILSVLGAVDTGVFSNLIRKVNGQDVVGAIKCVDEVVMSGRELQQFVVDLIWYLRNLMLVKSSDDMEDVLDMSSDNIASLKEEANMMDMAVIMRYIHILSELGNEMRLSSQKRVLLEMALIRLIKPQMDEDFASILNRLAILENQVSNGVVVRSSSASDGNAQANTEPQMVSTEPFPEAVPKDIQKAAAMWNQIVQNASRPLSQYLNLAYVTVKSDGEALLLVYDSEEPTQATAYKMISQEKNKVEIKRIVSEHVGAEVPIDIRLDTSALDRAHKYTDAVEKFSQEIGVQIVEEDF